MAEFNALIHQPVRLRIMAALHALPPEARLEFGRLQEMLEVTEGNLASHLRKLEDAGYIRVEKTFVGRRPRTYVAITEAGRRAFEEHVEALRALLRLDRGADQRPGEDRKPT